MISSSFEEAIYEEHKLVLHARKNNKRLVLIYIDSQQRNVHIIIIIIIIIIISAIRWRDQLRSWTYQNAVRHMTTKTVNFVPL